MRVLYDHQVTSLQDAGGVSRYYFELVRALLATQGIQAALLLGWNRSVFPFTSLRPAPGRTGARVLSFESRFGAGGLRYAVNEALTCALAPWWGKCDVYHATYQRLLPAVLKGAVVVTHHDSTPDRFPELFRNADAIHARLKKVYERADRVICISESSRADLLHYFRVPVDKTVVIHHGFTPLAEDSGGASRTWLPNQPYLLYTGARHAYKNFPLVLEALARQRSQELHLLAAGGGQWTAPERECVARLGLGKRVHLMPRPTDEQMAAAYRGARLLVYPSLYEGFGFPPLEAMAAGCPALVSRTAALPEVCGDAAFYFDPASVEQLSVLVEELHENETQRLSKQLSGREQVAKYTWEKAAAQTLEAYRTAVHRQRQ